MRRDRLLINKEMIPYTFNIPLGDELFHLEVSYNKTHDFFTIALSKDEEVICEGEPIVYGMPLFHDLYISGKYPALDIIPVDDSGEQDSVTFENLGATVFLTVDNYIGGDEIE